MTDLQKYYARGRFFGVDFGFGTYLERVAYFVFHRKGCGSRGLDRAGPCAENQPAKTRDKTTLPDSFQCGLC